MSVARVCVAFRCTVRVIEAACQTDKKTRFQEVLTRIHSALVIAPSISPMQTPAHAAETMDAETGQPVLTAEVSESGMEEMAFVPAAQRQNASREPVVDDTIVVVGQTRTKKRKRPAKAAATEAVAAGEDEEMFDFETVSNILDEGSEPEVADKRMRKKGAKGALSLCNVDGQLIIDWRVATYQYGNFGAPPKAHSEVKSGNQSRTFRKG